MTPDPEQTTPEHRASEPRPPEAAPISADAKLALLRQNRERLDQDLMLGRLRFESKPRVFEFQLSNFCNMSCTMCYDGNNPPMKKFPEDVAERLAAEVFPTASVLSPFVGSEPLIVTWDLARGLAEQYGLELDVITNAQFLDDAKFAELEPHVSTLTFSIDSHLPDIYERIRLRSKPDKVFANLPRAAKLCLEKGIEPQANIVFMTENAAFIDETVGYLADQGCKTIRLLAFLCPPGLSADRDFSDALKHMSPEWVSWMLNRIENIAKEKQVRVLFEGRERHVFDYMPDDLEFRENRKSRLSVWDEIRYFYPGYCVQSVDHIKIHADGEAYPCCVAESGKLKLGNVIEQSFDEVWNSKEAQDLRRGMLTGDLPDMCKGCAFHTAWILPEQDQLPVIDWYHDVHSPERARVSDDNRTLAAREPAHMTRTEDAPTFTWDAPDHAVSGYSVVFGVGGTYHENNVVFEIPADATEFTLPEDAWRQFGPNLAMWWFLVAHDDGDGSRSTRTAKVRCLVRHQPIPRVEGSTLYD